VLHNGRGRGSGFSKVLKFPEKLVLPKRHVGPGKPQDVATSAVILVSVESAPFDVQGVSGNEQNRPRTDSLVRSISL